MTKVNPAKFIGGNNIFDSFEFNEVILYGGEFDVNFYKRELFEIFNIPFPDSLINAVVKRQAEYLAGRYMAINALKIMGRNIFDIPTGKHRSPIWSEGVVGSITHTHSTAFCAVAFIKDVQYLGIDYENWLPPDTIEQIRGSILNSNEEILLRRCKMGIEKAFTLAFSAKESLFKALYPSVGYYFDFMAAEITYVSVRSKKFELKLKQQLTPSLSVGKTYTGYFSCDLRGVNTLIANTCRNRSWRLPKKCNGHTLHNRRHV